jgi:4-amino-4-deoxy-L-arabinose transferase-like glycosyltransferase
LTSPLPGWRQTPVGPAALLWLAVVAVALASRPVLPVDETRYLAVAWEMWSRGDFVLPVLNGEAYSHKPPLLFWIIHAGWVVFGVNEWWPRLVAPLFGLGALFLTAALGRRLWPERRAVASAAPLILMASGFWALFTTLTMFDMILAFFALLGLLGVLDVWRHGGWRGWAVLGVAIGFGFLTKGPAIALHVLPVALLAPLWGGRLEGTGAGRKGWVGWYGGILLALVLGLAMALAWAVPAGVKGGAAFRDAIFWGQSAGRIVDSFAHGRPWWWYLATTPPLLVPLIAWPGLWRSVARRPVGLGDGGLRICLCWFGAAFLAFSAISGKQLHYLLPIFPALALALARVLAASGEETSSAHRDLAVPGGMVALVGVAILAVGIGAPRLDLPSWANSLAPGWALIAVAAGVVAAVVASAGLLARLATLALLSCALVVTVHMVARPALTAVADLSPLSLRLGAWEGEGRPLAHYGKYHGQFHFLGRLTKPLAIIGDGEVAEWVRRNPQGKIVTYHRRVPGRAQPDFVQPFRAMTIGVWDAALVATDLDLVKRPK